MLFFRYSSPLDWQKRSLPQLAIAQELDALCEAPWRVQVASHEALQQVLAARPAVLHLSAHSVLLAQGETRCGRVYLLSLNIYLLLDLYRFI